MKTSRYTEAQILAFLRQAESGMPVAELDLHRFCSGHVLMLGGPLFEGHW